MYLKLLAIQVVSALTTFNSKYLKNVNKLPLYLSPLSSLGAPSEKPFSSSFVSRGGIQVTFNVSDVVEPHIDIQHIISSLDDQKGLLLTSSYEYPGRYARWTVGFLSPPLQIEGTGLNFTLTSLNERGIVLTNVVFDYLSTFSKQFCIRMEGSNLVGYVIPEKKFFKEEERSQQPSLFSLIRKIKDLFYSESCVQLGLYGAFGYDLAFQFEPIIQKKSRSGVDQRDLLLYLPDQITVVDNYRNDAWKINYEFQNEKFSTIGIQRTKCLSKYISSSSDNYVERDTPKGEYAKIVEDAKEQFRVGNLFEVVLSQVFRKKLDDSPSRVFSRLLQRNPSPYGFFINLGENEYLVGASPEMFVRVEKNINGQRVETCPISGTIERGENPLEDAQQIKRLLLSVKEESELTMCTDVDRNDKSRICVPGSIKVLGRRQIEMYSKLIHTVDHVEGYLRKEYDSLDALLCHTWAVTVTGAPKTWAMRFVEETERSVRHWYGGAVGLVGFDGNLNTGLTLRTIRVKNGIGEVRAGATLLYDSDPTSEELETELKASAMLESISVRDKNYPYKPPTEIERKSKYVSRILLIDHEDSFVHTLADYLRQTGSDVATCRCGDSFQDFLKTSVDTGVYTPTLVVLSPGPGSPRDFQLSDTIEALIARKIPIFGVCLGLQGLVEYFGGSLGILPIPQHGKAGKVRRHNDDSVKNDILAGLPEEFQVGRYHSLYGIPSTLKQLIVTGSTVDGIPMSLCHESLPIAAVQFHPESILTLPRVGMKILSNAIELLKSDMY